MRKFNSVFLPCNAHFWVVLFYLQYALLLAGRGNRGREKERKYRLIIENLEENKMEWI